MAPAWRKLVLASGTYRWRRNHEHHVLPADRAGEGCCREVFLARREDGAGTLRLEFTDGDDVHAGYREAGVVWRSVRGADVNPYANLNLPRMARAAIELAIERGWQPGRGGTTIIDGWPLLDALIARHEELGDAAAGRPR